MPITTAQTLEAAAHVVQLALTPIFLLTGVGQLLNVFTTRLARVADRTREIVAKGDGHPQEVERLRLRSRILDIAVLLATGAGILTCLTAATLFSGAVRNEDAATFLFWFFGAALSCTMLALGASALETLLSTRSMRQHAEEAERRGAD
jgi:hypothetical protein